MLYYKTQVLCNCGKKLFVCCMYILLCCVKLCLEIPLGRKADQRKVFSKIVIDGGKIVMGIIQSLVLVQKGFPAGVCEVCSQMASIEKAGYI